MKEKKELLVHPDGSIQERVLGPQATIQVDGTSVPLTEDETRLLVDTLAFMLNQKLGGIPRKFDFIIRVTHLTPEQYEEEYGD